MPSILWTGNSLNTQDYDATENIIFQDNRSAIILKKNGKSSSVKRTKHINIQYCFVTDRIKKCEVTVDWCQTYDTTGGLFTKPNQGSLFRRFRDMIMGVVRKPYPEKGNNLGR